jgi:hypothetical protein
MRPIYLGGLKLEDENKWTEQDLRVGCRLLPGRDDEILLFLKRVGSKEKSYKIREALRTYVKLCDGNPFNAPALPVAQSQVQPTYFAPPPEPRFNSVPVMEAAEPKPQVPVLINDNGEEPSDSDVLNALKNLSSMFD